MQLGGLEKNANHGRVFLTSTQERQKICWSTYVCLSKQRYRGGVIEGCGEVREGTLTESEMEQSGDGHMVGACGGSDTRRLRTTCSH